MFKYLPLYKFFDFSILHAIFDLESCKKQARTTIIFHDGIIISQLLFLVKKFSKIFLKISSFLIQILIHFLQENFFKFHI